MKKLHPRFKEDQDDSTEELKLVYSSEQKKKEVQEDNIDPRWEELKKIFKK
jgi:uncharacterized metal-binding protein YceD (DUF177 family)